MALDKIKSLFEAPDDQESVLMQAVNELDHFEIARLLHQFSKEEKVLIFQYLDSDSKQQEVLYETDIESRKEIMEELGMEQLAPLLETMPIDEVTDIIQEHPPEMREELLDTIDEEDAQVIKDLIRYQEETAGGMMTPQFNKVTRDTLAGDLLMKLVRDTGTDHGYYYFVVDSQNRLVGFFKLRDLLHVPASYRVDQILREKCPRVMLEDSCEKVANLMDHEHMSILPVVDSENVIHGIVTFDDVLRVMKDEASEDIFTMVGTAKVDPFAKRTMAKVKTRAPWLMTTFIGGLLSAFVLYFFQFKITEFATVLFFVPFVLGLAGNVGIQGATVIVRGLATGDIQEDNLKKVVTSELMVGLINGSLFGILCGIAIALAAKPLLNSQPILGLSVGVGIVLAVATASLIGSLAPWGFLRLNIDPAISTGPVVTVINDILGLFIYLTATAIIFSLPG